MHKRLVSSTLLIVFQLAGASCSANEGALPARKDCIVHIQLDWDASTPPADRLRIVNNVAEVISQAPAALGRDYLSSVAVPRGEPISIYLQFVRGCSRRVNMATKLIQLVRNNVVDAPSMEIDSAEIEPGPDTIDVWGPAWSE